MSRDFLDLIRMKRLSANTFETLSLSERMGNSLPIAYGGCALAFAVQAAFHTLSPDEKAARLAPYSLLGVYLGPTATDRQIRLAVEDIRTTRTFATRRVMLTQLQDDGTVRSSLEVTIDFITSTPVSFLTYNVPMPLVDCHSKLLPYPEALKRRTAARDVDPQVEKVYNSIFGLMQKMVDIRIPESAPLGQNAWGIAKARVTSQEHLPMTRKTSSYWIKSRIDLSTAETPVVGDETLPISYLSASAALMGFVLDGVLSFLPLAFSNHFLQDVGACSTLDFAIRFHTDVLDMNQWHLEEMRTIAGGSGRTFSEGRLWRDDGILVATVSQQCILRPSSPKKQWTRL